MPPHSVRPPPSSTARRCAERERDSGTRSDILLPPVIVTSPVVSRREARVLWIALALGAMATIVIGWQISRQSWILGGREAGWFYRYYQYFSARMAVVFVATAAATILLLWMPRPRSRRHERLLLFAWWAFGLGAALLVRSVSSYTLESLFASDGASGFYAFAGEHTPSSVLRQFNRVRRTGPLHVQANMPGKLMLVYALEVLTANPKWLAGLIVLISSLGGFMMHALVKRLLPDERTALYAAILYWLYPARLFFLPIMNTVTPVLVLACALLLVWWLRTSRTLPAVLLGIGLYGLVFFEPLPLAAGPLFVFLVLRSIALGHMPWQRWTVQACGMAAAFIATSEAVHAATGFELLGALRQTASHASTFNLETGRPYGFWVRGNLVEFAFGVGFCQAALFCGVTVSALLDRGRWLERLTHPIATICLGAAASILLLEAVGINRGEVIRLWIFLGCFVQVSAAYACARLGRPAIVAVAVCALLIATLGTGMIAFTSPQ